MMSDQETLEWESSDSDLDPANDDERPCTQLDLLDNTSIFQAFCSELAIFPEYECNAIDLCHNHQIRIRVALEFEKIDISPEYLSAIGCDPNFHLALEVCVDQHKLHVKSVNVGTIVATQSIDNEVPITPCALSSPLLHRIKLYLDEYWNGIPGARRRQFNDVIQIRNVCNVDYFWGLTALVAARFDASDAILLLAGVDTSLLRDSLRVPGPASEVLLQEMQDAVRQFSRQSSLLMLILCQWDIDLAIGLTTHASIRNMVEKAASVITIDDFRTISLVTGSNPIARLADAFLNRFLTLNETCYLCNGPLEVTILRLGICDSPLCNHQFEECGIGFSLEEEICRRPELSDLLISMCASASKGGRFLFFPKAIRDPKSGSTLSTDQQDLAKIGAMLDQCPSVADMAVMARQGTLIKDLRANHLLLPSLLRWILTSNRSHIRLLEKSDHVNGIDAGFQFVLLTSSPKKEALFRQRMANSQRDRPVEFAFHGSPQANWHSIVRQGLLNMSGTSNQLHGAAYGSGIYMAPHILTSLSYSRGYVNVGHCGWKNSMFGADWHAVALCEVANTKSLKTPNPYWVVPDADMVVTRYLFIFTSSSSVSQREIDSRHHFSPDLTAKFRNLSRTSSLTN